MYRKSETWTLTKPIIDRLGAFEMWTLKRMMEISWKQKTSNERVLQMEKMKREIITIVKGRKLRSFGHIFEALIITERFTGR